MESLVNYSTGHFHVFTKILKPFTIGSKIYVLYEKMNKKMYTYMGNYIREYMYMRKYMRNDKYTRKYVCISQRIKMLALTMGVRKSKV